MTSVGADFPVQQARVRKLMVEYREIGPAGAFALAMMEQALAAADAAMASGDIVAILGAYTDLVAFE